MAASLGCTSSAVQVVALHMDCACIATAAPGCTSRTACLVRELGSISSTLDKLKTSIPGGHTGCMTIGGRTTLIMGT